MSRRSMQMRCFLTSAVMERTCGVIVALICAMVTTGCSTTSRDYPGVSHDALWQATLDAARHPQYNDWFVCENGVFVDESQGRIEIYRELKRDHAPPGAALERQHENWTFSVRIESDDRVPKVSMHARSGLVSPNFWSQCDHFFGEIDARLAQRARGDAGGDGAGTAPTALLPPADANSNGLESPSATESGPRTSRQRPSAGGSVGGSVGGSSVKSPASMPSKLQSP